MQNRPKILLIYTGGTIGMIRNIETGALKAFNFDELINKIPEIKLIDCEINSHSFEEPIDSSDMNIEHWSKIADTIAENYYDYDGFVILHGSDTMSYTASALSFMLQNLDKAVILTGSQLPIGDLRTDAKENLITAIQIASLRAKSDDKLGKNNNSLIREVCLYFEYKLYRGNRTTKISSEFFNAFTSPNYPHLIESGVNLSINKELLLRPKANEKLKVYKNLNSKVAILKIFPGIYPELINGVVNTPHLKGLIIETYGTGNAPTSEWFKHSLKMAIDKGINVVNISQCASGCVNMEKYEAGIGLKEIGVISGKDLTLESALAKMLYLLGRENIDFKTAYETPISGEMDANK